MKTSTLFWVAILFIGFASCQVEESPIVFTDTKTLYTETTDSPTGMAALQVTDLGQGTGTITWSADKVILLDGFVFVNAGQTLQIEAGTIIKGLAGEGENASALVVARGATIIAEGTADNPIIFTSVMDSLNGNLTADDKGLWGGLIILGAAELNSSPGVNAIEGIPQNEFRGLYGGSNDQDNSGILSYISIRHGGTNIGQDNEINGLTLAGIGQQTSLSYIEIYANLDDGIEFFGGQAEIHHLIVAHCADDGIDYDEGFRGSVQFAFIYQGDNIAGHGGEHDGGTDPEDGTPYATPELYNITSIGSGLDGDQPLMFRDNAGGKYHNSIFFNYAAPITIELLQSGEHSYNRLTTNDLEVANNVFWNTPSELAVIDIGDGVSSEDEASANSFLSSYIQANNTILDLGITRQSPIPTTHSLTLSSASSSFFETTDYVGAFDPNAQAWYEGWSKIDEEL